MKYATPATPDPTEFEADHVYQPAEDTFVLLDALEAEEVVLKDADPFVCIEMGCGSGVVISFLNQLLGQHRHFIATDINPTALDFSQRTAKINNVHVDFVRADLIFPLLGRLEGKVDLLVFNPPYVPTEEIEVYRPKIRSGDDTSGIIAATWAGGSEGLACLEVLLPLLKKTLSPSGLFYFVALHSNNPRKLVSRIMSLGLSAKISFKRTAGIETLYIIKVQHRQPETIPP